MQGNGNGTMTGPRTPAEAAIAQQPIGTISYREWLIGQCLASAFGWHAGGHRGSEGQPKPLAREAISQVDTAIELLALEGYGPKVAPKPAAETPSDLAKALFGTIWGGPSA